MASTSEPPETVLFEGRPATLPTFTAWAMTVLTAGLAFGYFYLRARSTRVKITNQRVVIQTGLLSRRMDQIDTYRINDYVVEQPFGQRLVGTGNIVLWALDRQNPEVRLYGLKTDVAELYERLRRATEKEKARRGVRLLDGEPPG